TSAGADATQVAGATDTIAKFRQQFTGANDYGGYTRQAYDGANALMTAIGNAIKSNGGNKPSRKQVRDAFAAIKSFKGVIGTYDFDQNGDTSLKIVSIYVVNQVSVVEARRYEPPRLRLLCPVRHGGGAAGGAGGPPPDRVRPDLHLRPHARLDLCPRRAGLHDGLRDHRADQLRPR